MNLVTGTYAAYFTGALRDHFDTFSNWRTIIVNKEPTKTVINQENSLFGYGEQSVNDNYTLTPVSGSFPCIVINTLKANEADIFNKSTKTRETSNELKVKVKWDAKEFIVNGKTVNVIVDENIYNISSNFEVQNYLGLKYYYFNLQNTY